jgi:Iap family predicted aminopeptidase
MVDNIRSLVKEHHVFYEVSPYYVEVEERPIGRSVTTRRIQAGINVDVYGVRTEDNKLAMPPAHEYGSGYAELERLAEKVSQHTTDSCSLEVVPYPSVAIVDTRNHGKVEGMLRITISHFRGLDQPAGLAEQRALEEVERELKSLGIVHR